MRRFLFSILMLLPGFFSAGATVVPVPQGSVLVSPSGRGIHAAETIVIHTRWDSAGYRIVPSFQRLDGTPSGQVAVVDSLNGAYLLTYTTGSMTGLSDSAGVVIPITAFGRDSSFTDNRLTVCRNNASPLPIHVGTGLVNPQTAYHPGENLIVSTRWRVTGVPGFRIVPDFRALAPGFRESNAHVGPPQVIDDVSTYEISYQIPAANLVVPDGNGIPLTVYGMDDLCSVVRTDEATLNLRRGGPPIPRSHEVLLPNLRGIRDGDLLRIATRWDSSGYTVRADFSALDGSATLEEARPDTAPGTYLIDHVVLPMGSLPDDSLIVPIIATNRLGDRFTDGSFQICRNRSTPPPESHGTWIRNDKRRFRSNDSLVVFSRWTSPVGLRVDVVPRYQNLVPRFQPSEAQIVRRGVDTTLIAYRLPLRDSVKDPLAPDGRDIPLVIMARDRLWGLATPETLLVDLDTTPPSSPPVFDPLPAETKEGRIRVSGVSPGAAQVAIAQAENEQDLKFSFFTPADSAGRFEAMVNLTPGRNKVGGWSEDDLGNRTTIGLSQIVRYVTARTTSYPTPYLSNSDIIVEDEDGMREVQIDIYNLEGERVVELSQTGSLLAARLRWDGMDSHGDRAQPGYYLMRVRRVSPAGKVHQEVLPLLFRNDNHD